MMASIVGFHSGVRMDAGTGKYLGMLLKPQPEVQPQRTYSLKQVAPPSSLPLAIFI